MDVSIFSKGIKVLARARTGSVKQVSPPSKAIVLLRQCAGCKCEAVVKKGSEVSVGQTIAKSTGADLHSPVSGSITGFEDLVLADGSKCPAVIIENDGRNTQEKTTSTTKDLIDVARAAGIVTSGRNGGSLAEMISQTQSNYGHDITTGQPLVRRVDHLIIRCCDVDPHLWTQTVAADELDDLTDLKASITALVESTEVKMVHFVLSKGQKNPALEKFADEMDYQIHRVDSSRYPMTADPFLTKKISGKEPRLSFNSTNLSGTLVLDVTTIIELAASLKNGDPIIEKTLTVVGPKETIMCKTRIGTPISKVLAALKMTGEFEKVIIEGPLGGSAIHTLDYPVTKNMSGLTLISKGNGTTFENDPCISCGICAMACPTRLIPGMLSRYCEFGDFEKAEAAHIFNCIECGCCAYVCPAGRSMVQLMVLGKSELTATRRACR